MKRFLLIISILFLGMLAYSQEMKVVSFTRADRDMTAQNNRVLDINDKVCALIKVETSNTGLAFDFGTKEITRRENPDTMHPGEIWLYVQSGVTKVTIQQAGYSTIRDYPCPEMLQSGRTYILKLTNDKVTTIIEQRQTQQFVLFNITPKDAVLELDGKFIPLNNGSASKLMLFGTYNYSVEAPFHHPERGKVSISNPNEKTVVDVNLQPAFGSLTVGGSATGAIVFFDKKKLGTIPLHVDTIESGKYNIKIVKPMYKNLDMEVVINDGQLTSIEPVLDPNFSHVTFNADNNAEIWINGEMRGYGSVSDDFEEGTYVVECKLANHRQTSMTKNVVADGPAEIVTLPKPIPINSSLSINSTPPMAEVRIDGKIVGETPLFVPSIIIGRHDVVISMAGYSDCKTSVTVLENETVSLDTTLTNTFKVHFSCNVQDAVLYIDGQPMPNAYGTYDLTKGRHSVICVADGYNDFKGNVNVGNNAEQKYDISMSEIVKKVAPVSNEIAYTPKVKQPRTKPEIETRVFATVNLAYSIRPQLSYGFKLGYAKRWGWYLGMMFDAGFIKKSSEDDSKAELNCNNYGVLMIQPEGSKTWQNTYVIPSYSGEVRKYRFATTIGGVCQVYPNILMNLGLGFGDRTLYWETTDGKWVKNLDSSFFGVNIELGMTFIVFDLVAISLDAVTINGKYWEGQFGIGIGF